LCPLLTGHAPTQFLNFTERRSHSKKHVPELLCAIHIKDYKKRELSPPFIGGKELKRK
jgi:hypothetical protein